MIDLLKYRTRRRINMHSFITQLAATASKTVENAEAGSMSENLYKSLEVMGKGMLGIFIALSIVFGFVLLLTRYFPSDKSKDELTKGE